MKHSKIVGTGKFVTLSILSMGLYPVVWAYYNRVHIRGEQLGKFPVGFLSFFLTISCLLFVEDVKDHLAKHDIMFNYQPWMIAFAYFLLSISYYILPGAFKAIIFLNFLPFLPVLYAMNTYREQQETLLYKKESFLKSLLLMFFTIIIGLIVTVFISIHWTKVL